MLRFLFWTNAKGTGRWSDLGNWTDPQGRPSAAPRPTAYVRFRVGQPGKVTPQRRGRKRAGTRAKTPK